MLNRYSTARPLRQQACAHTHPLLSCFPLCCPLYFEVGVGKGESGLFPLGARSLACCRSPALLVVVVDVVVVAAARSMPVA